MSWVGIVSAYSLGVLLLGGLSEDGAHNSRMLHRRQVEARLVKTGQAAVFEHYEAFGVFVADDCFVLTPDQVRHSHVHDAQNEKPDGEAENSLGLHSELSQVKYKVSKREEGRLGTYLKSCITFFSRSAIWSNFHSISQFLQCKTQIITIVTINGNSRRRNMIGKPAKELQ